MNSVIRDGMQTSDAPPSASSISASVRRLASVEIWERFSFYSMNLLLPLFLVAPVEGGGFGWSAAAALRFAGGYIAIVQFLPVIGGYVGDRWLGGKKALNIGAWSMLIGHLLLCGPHIIPMLATDIDGAPVAALLAGTEFGHWSAPHTLSGAASTAYRGITMSFFLSIGLIALGNGFFKPALAAMLGRLPYPRDTSRDAAYVLLYQYVHIGAIAASVGSGWLAQRFGWQWAFGAAGAGMAAALALMRRLRADPIFDSHHVMPADPSASQTRPFADAPAASFLPVVVLLVLAMLFFIGDYQVVGFVDVFTQLHVDRTIFGFQIPATWFISLNPLLIVTIAPLLTRLALRHAAWGNFGIGRKIGSAFLLTAVAFLLLWAADSQAQTGALANPVWIIGCVACLTLGELLVAPIGAAAVSRLAPRHRLGLVLGMWYAANGVGGWLSGQLGAAVVDSGENILFGTACCAMALGLLLWSVQRPLRRVGL